MGMEQKLLLSSLRLAYIYLDRDPERSPFQLWHWLPLLDSYQHHRKLRESVLECSEIPLESQGELGARVSVLF